MSKNFYMKIIRNVMIIAIIFIISGCFISYAKFGNANFPKTFISLIRIVCNEDDYIKVKSTPKVIVAKPSQALFENFLANEGYRILEDDQLGSVYTVEKQGVQEQISFSINRYYSKWIWADNS